MTSNGLAALFVCLMTAVVGVVCGWFAKSNFPDKPVIELRLDGAYINGHKLTEADLKNLLKATIPLPEKKKDGGHWWGDENKKGEKIEDKKPAMFVPPPPSAHCPCGAQCDCVNCQCKPIVLFALAPSQQVVDQSPVNPITNNRNGSPEILGLDKLLDRILIWLDNKSTVAGKELERREKVLSEWTKLLCFGGLAIVAFLGIPLWGTWLFPTKS
jgi:hypothetical protein